MAIIILSVIYSSIKDVCRKARVRSLRKAYTKSRAKLQEDLKLNHYKRVKRLKEILGWGLDHRKKQRHFVDDDTLFDVYCSSSDSSSEDGDDS